MWPNIINNAYARNVRRSTFQGREYLITPVTMLVEGVHSGSNGPLFYSAAELSKNPGAWNGMPVTVRHPTGPDGRGVSACDPIILEKQGVGMVKNSKWDKGQLRAEVWLDPERLQTLAPGIHGALLNSGGMVEVSTGLFSDNEYAPGHHAGVDFVYRAINHQPDHLALLPEGVGACSQSVGCGLKLNHHEESDTMNTYPQQLPPPLFGQAPVINSGTGDRDDFGPDDGLPIPTLSFGPEPTVNCGCADKAKAKAAIDDADADGLPLPVMNFEKPTVPAGNHGVVEDDDGLQLPKMTF